MLRNIVSIVLFSTLSSQYVHADMHIQMERAHWMHAENSEEWEEEIQHAGTSTNAYWESERYWNNACGWICSMCSSDMHTSASRHIHLYVQYTHSLTRSQPKADKMAKSWNVCLQTKENPNEHIIFIQIDAHTHIHILHSAKRLNSLQTILGKSILCQLYVSWLKKGQIWTKYAWVWALCIMKMCGCVEDNCWWWTIKLLLLDGMLRKAIVRGYICKQWGTILHHQKTGQTDNFGWI